MARPLNVFVSSVFRDMAEARERAEEAIRLVGGRPHLAEKLTSLTQDVRRVLESMLAECDTYVGLFSEVRGTLVGDAGGSDHGELTITEYEFVHARKLGCKCLVFYDKESMPASEVNALVARFEGGVYPCVYPDLDRLGQELTTSLAALRPRLVLNFVRGEGDTPGWTARLHTNGLAPCLDPALSDPEPFPFDPALSATAAGVFDRFVGREDCTPDQMRILGGDLGAKLPGPTLEALSAAVTAQRESEASAPITLEIRSGDPEILGLPWETITLGGPEHPVREGRLEIVRRVVGDGDEKEPPATELVESGRAEFSVLGFTADPVDDHGRSVRLGADGGLGRSSTLFWEQEQEQLLTALTPILAQDRGRLVFPDTGDAEELKAELARRDRPKVVHLGCHGGPYEFDGARRQALFLENEEGGRRAVSGGDLLGWLHGDAPRVELAVLSACYTAAQSSSPGAEGKRDASKQAHVGRSLAEELVRDADCPRVLGMQTAVTDRGATLFAGRFYEALAKGSDLVFALSLGRRAFLEGGLPPHEWAIPALWTGAPALPLAAPFREQPAEDVGLEQRDASFDIADVAYLGEGYVGRREFARRFRRAWGKKRLLAVHGIGGIGKSTLAARAMQRRAGAGQRCLVIAVGEVQPKIVIEEVAKQLGIARGGQGEEEERQFQRALGEALRAKPTVLLFDNFEDNQVEDGGALREPELADEIGRLIDLGKPDLRVLVTTRRALELTSPDFDYENLPLGELSPSEARKLRVLYPGLAVLTGAHVPRVERRELDERRWREILETFGGHPKALTLLGNHLSGNADRLDELLGDVRAQLAAVESALEKKEQRQGRGRQLLLDRLLGGVPAEHLPALERLSLLRGPLSRAEHLELLAKAGIEGADPALNWLTRQGLLAPTLSVGTPGGGEQVHRLVASRLQDSMPEAERRIFHGLAGELYRERKGPLEDYELSLRHLVDAGRPAEGLEAMVNWCVALQLSHAYAACIEVGQRALRLDPDADVDSKVARARVYSQIHDSLWPLGRIQEAREALDRMQAELTGVPTEASSFMLGSIQLRWAAFHEHEGDSSKALRSFERARTHFRESQKRRDEAIALGGIARLKAQAGDVLGAMDLHEETLAIFQKLGDVRSRAVTLGDVARLKVEAGDVPGAMDLYDEMLGIFRNLGDVRERAVTLGDIARLKAQAGDVQGATDLFEEVLGIFQKLGDVRSWAVTLGDIARLKAQAGDVQGAMDHHEKMLGIFQKLGDVRERAITLGDIARLKARAGDVQGAMKMFEEKLQVAEKLGDVRSRAVTLGDIARLKAQAGDVQGATDMFEEKIRVAEKLGDVRSRAVTLGDIAHLEAQAGNVQGAIERNLEREQVNRELDDVDGIASVCWDLGKLYLMNDDAARALPKLKEAWERISRLGRADGIAIIGSTWGAMLHQSGFEAEARPVLELARAAAEKLGLQETVSRCDAFLNPDE